MERFEKQFEDLDVQTETMELAMNNTTSLVTPQDQVEKLMMEVAEEHGIKFIHSFIFYFFLFPLLNVKISILNFFFSIQVWNLIYQCLMHQLEFLQLKENKMN